MESNRSSPELRLSAVRAFIGVIRPEYRRIGVTLGAEGIILTVELESCSEEVEEDISDAATEIIADFDNLKIHQEIVVTGLALPSRHIVDDGLIYQRWEGA